jgi:hypothetical protein
MGMDMVVHALWPYSKEERRNAGKRTWLRRSRQLGSMDVRVALEESKERPGD